MHGNLDTWLTLFLATGDILINGNASIYINVYNGNYLTCFKFLLNYVSTAYIFILFHSLQILHWYYKVKL